MLSMLMAILAVVAAATTMLWLPSCHKAYSEHSNRLVTDAWLFKQCQDADFATRMRSYTDSCEHVNALFLQPSWRVAAQTCLPPAPPTWLLFMVLLMPSVLLPIWRARQDDAEQRRMLKACSPFCQRADFKRRGNLLE